jgi:hypothetical protein
MYTYTSIEDGIRCNVLIITPTTLSRASTDDVMISTRTDENAVDTTSNAKRSYETSVDTTN